MKSLSIDHARILLSSEKFIFDSFYPEKYGEIRKKVLQVVAHLFLSKPQVTSYCSFVLFHASSTILCHVATRDNFREPAEAFAEYQSITCFS